MKKRRIVIAMSVLTLFGGMLLTGCDGGGGGTGYSTSRSSTKSTKSGKGDKATYGQDYWDAARKAWDANK